MKSIGHLNAIRALQLYQLFRFAAVFVTGILLAKTGYSTESISQYETFLFVSYAASFFWLSGLVNTLLALFPRAEHPRILLFNAALLLLILSGVAALTVIVLDKVSFSLQFESKMIALYIAISVPAFLNEYILLLHDKKRALVGYGMGSFAVQVLLIGIVLLKGYSIHLLCWALILIAMIKLLFLVVLLIRYAAFQIQPSMLNALISSGTPLALSYLLSSSAEVIDGIIVKKYFSETDFAIFRYGARELPIVLLLANAFSSAAIPKVAANLNEGLEIIKKNALQLYNIFFPITLALLFFSKKLFALFFSDAFVASASVFNMYLLLIISRLLFPQTIINALGASRILLFSAFVEVIINLGASLLLMQQFGLAGIAAGTVIAHLCDKLMLIAYCKYRLNIAPDRYISLFQHFFFSLLLLLSAYWIHMLG